MENVEHHLKKRNSWFHHYRQLLLATVAYILANVFDYLITIYGLANTNAIEGNPVARNYIAHFGPEIGLLIFKTIMVSLVLLGIIGFIILYQKKKTRIKPEMILSIGAIMTFLGACIWLTHF